MEWLTWVPGLLDRLLPWAGQYSKAGRKPPALPDRN